MKARKAGREVLAIAWLTTLREEMEICQGGFMPVSYLSDVLELAAMVECRMEDQVRYENRVNVCPAVLADLYIIPLKSLL